METSSFKINVDGWYLPYSGTRACGRIICDSNAGIVKCFSKYLGYCNVLLAVMHNLKYDIQFSRDLNIQQAHFKMDLQMVVQMIKGKINYLNSIRNNCECY